MGHEIAVYVPGGGRRRPGPLPAALLALAAVALATAGCGGTPTLAATLPSDEALAHAVLDGIARGDAEGLMRLAVTREEFEGIVWPTLPASRPEVGMPSDYVWRDTFTKSRAYLARTLDEHGGQRFALVRVETRGQTTEHDTYTIGRDTHLVVKDAAGQERSLRFFGSIIRQHGRSKVYSFIVD